MKRAIIMEWLVTNNREGSVELSNIPVLEYSDFYEQVCEKLSDTNFHIATYFATPQQSVLAFYCLLLDDSRGEVLIASHHYDYYEEHKLSSISAQHPQMHPFEREITELYGIKFADNPWDKPLRYPHNRKSKKQTIENYPFYSIQGASLHEVNVGPVHAGIIEPGVFRFICNGERVLHLEIVLGYQHRGWETLMVGTTNRLRQSALAESLAGDSVVAHSSAYAAVVEKLAANVEYSPNRRVELERAMALELERMAVHIADTGALCTDIGYQLGQVASEALRTIVINSTQLWCGNRFAKGAVRPFGSHFKITPPLSEEILRNIEEVNERFKEVREDLKSTSSLLARFENCGTLSTSQLQTIGAVGVAAKAGGVVRDVRATHPWGVWGGEEGIQHEAKTSQYGDVMSRLAVRGEEAQQSAEYIFELLERVINEDEREKMPKPQFDRKLKPNALAFSLVEGWRGEVCHVAVTNKEGEMECYKVKDPSMHNWLALAIAVRGEGISDFPICNKSFGLSYCGHDL